MCFIVFVIFKNAGDFFFIDTPFPPYPTTPTHPTLQVLHILAGYVKEWETICLPSNPTSVPSDQFIFFFLIFLFVFFCLFVRLFLYVLQ